MMTGQKRVNIKQVAQSAGVSTQTVSRVLNDRPDVAPETRRRVLSVIEELQYQPSVFARGLSQGRTHTIGVVTYGFKFYGPARTFAGIEMEANQSGYSLSLRLMPKPESADVAESIKFLMSQRVDGIVWAVPEIENNRDNVLQIVERLPIPVVFLSMHPAPGLSVIAINNRLGGRMATEHLLSRNYRKIGHIAGRLTWWEARQRLLGYQDVLTNAGLTCEDSLVVEGDWNPPSGEKCLETLLKQRPDVEAVFVANDQEALGALHMARKLGRRVPEDLAMVGFDDIPEAAYFCPPLSTVRQDLGKLGRMAVQELDRMIELRNEGRDMTEPVCVVLESTLIVRESSGHPVVTTSVKTSASAAG